MQSTRSTYHFHGRWDLSSPGRAVTVNSGSYIKSTLEVGADRGELFATFDISLNEGFMPTLTWQVDEGIWEEAVVSERLSLAPGLPTGQHTLTLMVRGVNEEQPRWSPPLTASTTFLDLEVTGGQLLPTERPHAPKIEFLGDSITEGVAVFDDRPGKLGRAWCADARLAYASRVGIALNADYRQVGFGALGILQFGKGGVPYAPDAFNWCYEGVPRDHWQPDVVVLNQGTNDAGRDTSAFAVGYRTLLGRIREAYPAASILTLPGFRGDHAGAIRDEVDKRRTAGDLRITYVDTAGWLSGEHFTDGLHPNAQGGAVICEKLLPIIEPLLPR